MNINAMTESQQRKVLAMAEQNYVALLKHPHDKWRIDNQHALCNARELVAMLTGKTGEQVQNRFEQIIWDAKELCDMLNRHY